MKIQVIFEDTAMPSSCNRCKFGDSQVSGGVSFCSCKINGKYGSNNERPTWCPLKEVKTESE